jgi:hypothetical protein
MKTLTIWLGLSIFVTAISLETIAHTSTPNSPAREARNMRTWDVDNQVWDPNTQTLKPVVDCPKCREDCANTRQRCKDQACEASQGHPDGGICRMLPPANNKRYTDALAVCEANEKSCNVKFCVGC